jgi:hypothetical protein
MMLWAIEAVRTAPKKCCQLIKKMEWFSVVQCYPGAYPWKFIAERHSIICWSRSCKPGLLSATQLYNHPSPTTDIQSFCLLMLRWLCALMETTPAGIEREPQKKLPR